MTMKLLNCEQLDRALGALHTVHYKISQDSSLKVITDMLGDSIDVFAELVDFINQHEILPHDDFEQEPDVLCIMCDGSGEGDFDGSICSRCNGMGGVNHD